MIDGVGVDGLDDGQIVDDFRGVREELADPAAGLSVLLEIEDGASDWEGALSGRHAGDALAHANAVRQFGSRRVSSAGLQSKRSICEGPPDVEEDDAFGRWGEIGEAREASGSGGDRRRIGGEKFRISRRRARRCRARRWQREKKCAPRGRPMAIPTEAHRCYSLVMVSSRFRMVLATVVQAASWRASMLPGFGVRRPG